MSRQPRRSVRHALVSLAGVIALVAGLLVAVATPASAAATRDFTRVFSTNTTGDIMIRGNSMMTCPVGSQATMPNGQATGPACDAVQSGAVNGVNNSFMMGYVDIDSDSSTFNSSSATVTIPAGATVLYAGLSWAALATAGQYTPVVGGPSYLVGVPAPSPPLRNKASFKPPGASSYSTVTSTQSDGSSNYQEYADVTTAVAAAGSGVYTVGNVQAGTGGNSYAGWSLTIAYQKATLPYRNLVVWTGYNNVAAGTPVTVNVSGFLTPATGHVVTRVGAVTYEGDRGSTGDALTLAGTDLFNSLNPLDDVFNSSVTDLNVAVTDRTPSHANLLGEDIDRFEASGILANSSTSASISLRTSSEQYFPGVVTFATDLYPATLTGNKTVTDVNGGNVSRGDRLNYSTVITSIGQDAAVGTALTDAIPVGTTYIPGSLQIGGMAVSDAAGDDAGDVVGANVTARLGTGATGTAGGRLAIGASTTVSFGVTVNGSITDGTVIDSIAIFSYNDETGGAGHTGASNTTETPAVVPPIVNVSTNLPGADISVAYTTTLAAALGTAPYTWTVSAGALPPGLTLSQAGVLSGTPTSTGLVNFTVEVTDANGNTGSKPLRLTVSALPTVTTASVGPGQVGVAFTTTLAKTGGTGSVTWSVSTGSLPPGLTLSPAGVLSGTPTAAGSYPFTAQVTDAAGGSGTKAFTFVVGASPALTYTSPLPQAVVGAGYSNTLTKTGGTGPFVWSVSAGTLPAGLSLSAGTGLISGTPTTAGTATFTVTVTDANGQSDSKATSLLIKNAASLSLSASTGSVRFGTAIILTATVAPAGATGTVTFTDVPTTGPQAGQTVSLGTGTVSGGVASLSTAPPTFGVNTIKATYSGDGAHTAATSTTTQVEVSAYVDQVIVTEFRTSGPGGANDSYTELYNTGAPVPLAGFVVTSSSGTAITLPVDAGTLGTHRSYLLTGAGYSLGGIAGSDDAVPTLGSGGVKVQAPDTAGTQTDAAGPSAGFHRGTALAAVPTTVTAQHAWVRAEVAGRPVNTGDNVADFRLVSTTGGLVGTQQSVLGSASPTGTANPFQHNATLLSTLLDSGTGQTLSPNRLYAAGAPGTLTVRRTITNNTGATITAAKVRITAISQANGDPQPGVTTQPTRVALLRVINPGTATSTVMVGGSSRTVQNLSVDAPSLGQPGGGLNSTLTVPVGAGLAPNASIDVAVTFAVDTGGTFWFGYDVDAK